MRTVLCRIKDDNSDWPESFHVTSAPTAVDEVQSILDGFNKGRPEKEKRQIVEVIDISVDNFDSMSKVELNSLKKIENEYIHLRDDVHKLRKKNLFTNKDGSDTYECSDCGIIGKRVGLNSSGISVRASLGQIKYCKRYMDFLRQ